MTIVASGPLKFSAIAAEFSGTQPIKLSQYYRGGALVPNGPPPNANIATSGAIRVSSFYGAQNVFLYTPATITSNVLNYDMRAQAVLAGWNQVMPLIMTTTVGSTGVIGSNLQSTSAFTSNSSGTLPVGSTLALIINAGGYVVGMGGQGESPSGFSAGYTSTGGTAITLTANISITNNGTIGGGGGGGGFGAYSGFNGLGGGGAGYLNGPAAVGAGGWGGGNAGSLTGGGGTIPYGGGGGSLGAHGGAGFSGSGGGAGGNATVGAVAHANWIVTGTRLGTVA